MAADPGAPPGNSPALALIEWDGLAGAASPGDAATASPADVRRPYLHQIDVVRLLTFAGVIAVHTIPLTTDPQNAAAGAAVALLHFTRNAFFLLSAFVLVLAEARRPLPLRRFWAHRFLTVGVPYVVWTVVYWWLNTRSVPRLANLPALGLDVLTGTGEYHLYFLLVTMQLYLTFPLLLALVRRTAGHHGLLLAVSFAVQSALMSVAHWMAWPAGWATLQAHDLVLLPMYQFYFLAGAVAAVHVTEFHDWVLDHPGAIIGLVVTTGALHEGGYLTQLAFSGSPAQASDPLQPTIVPWSVSVALGCYALGCAYARRRRSSAWSTRLVEQATLASFGIYLAHPLFLNIVLGRWLAYGATPLPSLLSAVLAWAGTLAMSFAFAALLIRTPVALLLVGRRQIARNVRPAPT